MSGKGKKESDMGLIVRNRFIGVRDREQIPFHLCPRFRACIIRIVTFLTTGKIRIP